jgi:hypothetical protein
MIHTTSTTYQIDSQPWQRVTNILDPLMKRAEYAQWDLHRLAMRVVSEPEIVAIPEGLTAADHALHLVVSNRETSAARVGTEIHQQIENYVLGNLVTQWQTAVDLYTDAMMAAKLAVVDGIVERIVRTPVDGNMAAAGWAGTLDQIVQTQTGTRFVADIKTGQTINWPAVAAQLAAYAHAAEMFDGTEWVPALPVATDIGLVIHLNVAERNATIHAVDLHAGWELFETCLTLWSLRGYEPEHANYRHTEH